MSQFPWLLTAAVVRNKEDLNCWRWCWTNLICMPSSICGECFLKTAADAVAIALLCLKYWHLHKEEHSFGVSWRTLISSTGLGILGGTYIMCCVVTKPPKVWPLQSSTGREILLCKAATVPRAGLASEIKVVYHRSDLLRCRQWAVPFGRVS